MVLYSISEIRIRLAIAGYARAVVQVGVHLDVGWLGDTASGRAPRAVPAPATVGRPPMQLPGRRDHG